MSFKNLNKFLSIVIFLLFAFSLKGFSQVIDYNPKTIIAGNGSVLTITGLGFGSVRGSEAYVVFGGFHPIKVLETDYVFWSDSEIRVKVPLGAIGSFTVVVAPSISYKVSNLNIAHLITSDAYSPSTISAGTESVLTITGSGFGPGKTANNAIEFLGANAQQSVIKAAASDFVSWSDTKIEVKIPSGVGDGPIYITLDNGTMKIIHPWLKIDFNVHKQNGQETKLYNQNGTGGYTFHLHTSLNSNNKAKAAFLRAFETWKCATGVNWTIGEPTSSKTGSNVVRILDAGEPEIGAPTQTTVSYVDIGGVWYVNNIAITFDDNLDHYFKFTPGDPGLYDFESSALHALGRAHNIGVVINTDDVMYWGRAVDSNEKRSLNPNDLNAGNFIMNLSTTASGSVPPMIPLPPGVCNPTYSYINSFSPTTGRKGDQITITGTDFTNITEVSFGGVPATSFNVVSPTTITAIVASGSASGVVSVKGAGGVATSLGFIFISTLPQILTFNPLPPKLYGDVDFDPGVTTNTGLPIIYTSSNPLVATIVNNKVHIVGAGTAMIMAIQGGNETYSAASVSLNLVVNRLSQTISFPAVSAKLTNDPDFDPGATASSGLAISYFSSNTAVATIVNSKVHIVGPGTTTITAAQAGSAIYSPATSVSIDLRVSLLAQTINFPNIEPKEFNSPDFDGGAVASSGLPIVYTSSNTSVASIVNNKIHIVGAGTTIITATQMGDATYGGAIATVNLVVNKQKQTISFASLDVKNHNDADFDLTATSSSGLPISYSSSNTAVASIIGNRVHIVASGTTVITASQAGNANILAAPDVARNLDVFFNIPNSNFTIKSTDETCKTSDNGAINITATQTLSYTATVTANNKTTTYPFNSVLAINNLTAGSYNVCITVAGQANYKQCFDVTVKEPKDLAAYASLKNDESLVVLKLEGSDFYKIELNGQLTTTTQQEITLPLIKGSNVVKVSTDKICQGVIEKVFLTTGGISLYPNPVKDILNISTGRIDSSPTKIDIHAVDGRLVHSSQQLAGNGRISVDLSRLSKGVYVLTLSTGNTKTVHKIIKD